MEDIIESLYNCGSLSAGQKTNMLLVCAEQGVVDINSIFLVCTKLGYQNAAKTLIERNPNSYLNYSKGLLDAAQFGYYGLAQIMLNCGASIHHCNNLSLELACRSGHFDVAKLLLERGSYINSNCLELAAENGNSKIVNLLLNNGGMSNGGTFFYMNALVKSSKNGHYYATRLLLEKHSYSKYDMDDAIDVAIKGEHFAVAKLLLDCGASSNRLSPTIYDKITRAKIPNLIYEY